MLNRLPRVVLLGAFCWFVVTSVAVLAQQSVPAAGAPATSGTPAEREAAARAKILDSECWRRANFELNEWFRAQTIYTREEVAELRADFAERVDSMSAQELEDVIHDMEAKFKILDSPQVQEVREWFGRFMSVLAERRREEILRDIPNFATMTPAELKQEIQKFQRKKNSQARFDRNRSVRNDAHAQSNRSRPAAVPAPRRAAAHAPYRPPVPQRPFEDVQIGPRRSMTIAPDGQIFMNMGF